MQDLGFRWGSCGKGDRVYFHWKTILLPPRVIEYVIVHELVHLSEAHHTPRSGPASSAFFPTSPRESAGFENAAEWVEL